MSSKEVKYEASLQIQNREFDNNFILLSLFPLCEEIHMMAGGSSRARAAAAEMFHPAADVLILWQAGL